MLEPPDNLTYRCILVDEVQDLGTVELDLIRSLVQQDVDGLFLVGDLRQQVFPKDHDLRAAGLGKLQRRYFRRNYRNTRQILEAAVALAKALGTSSGEEGELEQLDPEFSAREGPKPLAVVLSHEQREFEWIVGYIRLKRRDDQLPVCIVVCGLREDDDDDLRELARHYERHGLEVTLLNTDSRLRPGSVCLAALETIKGFEFSLVIVSQCSAKNMPPEGTPGDEEWREARRLYVAMTRARDELVFCCARKPSKFLESIQPKLIWHDDDGESEAVREGARKIAESEAARRRVWAEIGRLAPKTSSLEELAALLAKANAIVQRTSANALFVPDPKKQLDSTMRQLRERGWSTSFQGTRHTRGKLGWSIGLQAPAVAQAPSRMRSRNTRKNDTPSPCPRCNPNGGTYGGFLRRKTGRCTNRDCAHSDSED